jgi:hypothetical protein
MTAAGQFPEHDLFAQERMLVDHLSSFVKVARQDHKPAIREVKAARG